MFTGLIAGQGQIRQIQQGANEARLGIQALFDLPSLVLGESIAVNGVCLTVETHAPNQFTAYASAETLKATTLGGLKAGDLVNLERALAMGERFGGHIVAGHVDSVARVHSVTQIGQSRRIRLLVSQEASLEVVPKGSVTLDGISLTVNDCGEGYLEVNVIPETWRVTTIASWKTGSLVNLETDCIAKYVRHMLGPYMPAGAEKPVGNKQDISLDFLRENGFLA